MAEYPPAADPADIDSLRALHQVKFPTRLEVCCIKENGVAVSAWIMRHTKRNLSRYNEIYDSENPPATRAEALERAGATFYPYWYRCEVLRVWGKMTKATLLALGRLERTEENVHLAELELQENPDRLTDDKIAEERKTLAWVREEIERAGNTSTQAAPPRGLEGAS
ncbi:hypothetical protein VTL71DRAFT_3923 [Oculimacula yallundae]|uniref:Uncharacterized protein n=1 Tax=Oculimacula yallundae TaxID=86028 RepID=A0ABR4C4E7_9HELO